MEAILLCGGRGSRLKDVWQRPKCLVPVNNRPFLDYLLKSLSMRGFTRFIISIGYKKNLVKEVYKNSEYNIIWSEEDLPLGTGGAVKLALDKTVNRNVFVINGDTLFLLDTFSMLQFHRRNISLLTLAVKQFTKPFRLLPGGVAIVNTGIRAHLVNNTMFEDLFEKHPPNLYLSNDYLLDIGTPENLIRAQKDFLKFE